jgi:hypothetical protein
MIANVTWKATNARVGIVCAVPIAGTTSLTFCMPKKCRSPRNLPSPPKAREKPTRIQVTLTTAMAAKFWISMPRMCLARTMPP